MSILFTSAAVLAIGAGSVALIRKKNQEEEKKEDRLLSFIQYVLEDKVIFRKANNFRLFRAHYQASDGEFLLQVHITTHELVFSLSSIKGKREVYYHYVQNREKKIGQIIRMKKEWVMSYDTLYHKLERKIVENNWEKPIGYYAKQTFDLFANSKETKKEKKEANTEIERDILRIEELYYSIKEHAKKGLSLEENHNLERLFYKDFTNLKESYYKLFESSVDKEKEMKDALSLLEEKLNAYKEKLTHYHESSFDKTIEVIKKRR